MRCILVNTEEGYLRMEAQLSLHRVIGVDTEDNMLDTFHDDFQIVGISLAGDTQTGYYIPLGHLTPPGKEEQGRPPQLSTGWVLPRLSRFLSGRRVAGANHKFDHHVAAVYGASFGTTTFDALLAAVVWDSRDVKSKLEQLVFRYLGYKPLSIKTLCAGLAPKGQGKKPKKRRRLGFEFLTPEQALPYAAADAMDVMRLREYYAPRIKSDPGLSRIMSLEMELLPIIVDMEQAGVVLDEDAVRVLHKNCLGMLQTQLTVMETISGVQDLNPRSPVQVGDILYHRMGIPHPKGKPLYKKGTAPPAGWLDKDIVDSLLAGVKGGQRSAYNGWSAEQVTQFLEAYRLHKRVTKFKSTYTLSLLGLIASDNRLHTEFHQIGAATGRLASAAPNMQNLPRGDDKLIDTLDLRAAIVADEGEVFVRADFAGQEMRVIAALSKDPTLIGIFTGKMLDERGNKIDIHSYVASLAFDIPYLSIKLAVEKKDAEGHAALSEEEKQLVGLRQQAKPVTFGIAYGITKHGLAPQAGCSEKQAQDLIDTWRTKAFPVAAQWLSAQKQYLRQHLCTVTHMGRKRRLSRRALMLPDRRFDSVARPFPNHVIQGTSADMAKQAMIKTHKALSRLYTRDQARMVSMIHDEIIVSCKQEIAQDVAALMEREMYNEIEGVPFPVDAEISKTQSKKG